MIFGQTGDGIEGAWPLVFIVLIQQ